MALEVDDVSKIKNALVKKGLLNPNELDGDKESQWNKDTQAAYTAFLMTKSVPINRARIAPLTITAVHPALFEGLDEEEVEQEEDGNKTENESTPKDGNQGDPNKDVTVEGETTPTTEENVDAEPKGGLKATLEKVTGKGKNKSK